MDLTLEQIEAMRDIRAGLITERRLDRGVISISGPGRPGVIGRLVVMKLARWESRERCRVAVLTTDGEAALRV